MFEIGDNVTFILENNITLQGHNGNNGTMVYIDGGTFRMRTGSTITGNLRSITDNTGGAGVYISSGTFEMTGGTISGNTASYGGGVYTGGAYARGTFTMAGGIISGNTANYGGGVYVQKGAPFNMRDGIITGNVARKYGGGVCIQGQGESVVSFNKTGGTITGYNSDQDNGNVVKDQEGTIARRGHAVACDNARCRKETTVGPEMKLSTNNGCTGAWDK